MVCPLLMGTTMKRPEQAISKWTECPVPCCPAEVQYAMRLDCDQGETTAHYSSPFLHCFQCPDRKSSFWLLRSTMSTVNNNPSTFVDPYQHLRVLPMTINTRDEHVRLGNTKCCSLSNGINGNWSFICPTVWLHLFFLWHSWASLKCSTIRTQGHPEGTQRRSSSLTVLISCLEPPIPPSSVNGFLHEVICFQQDGCHASSNKLSFNLLFLTLPVQNSVL